MFFQSIVFLAAVAFHHNHAIDLSRVKAKQHRALVYLEPALVPTGFYIPLEGGTPVVVNKTLPVSEADAINALIDDLITHNTISTAAFVHHKKMAPKRAEAARRFLGGIKPLRSFRVPLGIFVPNQAPGAAPPPFLSDMHGSETDLEDEAVTMAQRRKLTIGMRAVVRKVRLQVKAKHLREEGVGGAPAFDYNATFNGLVVREAVYMPRGIYIPLANVPKPGEPNSDRFFSGLLPLSVVALPPGIFIPQSMAEFPDVPPVITPSDGSHGACDENEEFETVCGNGTSSDITTISPIPAIPVGPVDIQPEKNQTETEKGFREWITQGYEVKAREIFSKNAHARWLFETNITEANEKDMIAAQRQVDIFTVTTAVYIRGWPFKNITDPELVRLYLKLSNSGDAILPPKKWTRLIEIKSNMTAAYAAAKVCADTSIAVADIATCGVNQTWEFDPRVKRTFATSRNAELLKHLWVSWRDATGKAIKPDYLQYLILKNESSNIDGYPEVGLQWREPYAEIPAYNYSDYDFMLEVATILNQTMPLYKQLHAYVRRKLIDKYPQAGIKPNGAIPAHLLGNMWGENWRNILDVVAPKFLDKKQPDITTEMRKQNWTVAKMFKTADDFVVNLGLEPMTAEYWANSMFVKPNETERTVVCPANSFDFFDEDDFRTKMCADVTYEDLLQAHAEVARVQYFMQYGGQSMPFREGANEGFVEAVGAAFTLSVSSIGHLRKLKILPPPNHFGMDQSEEINYLLSVALEKIAAIPFTYLVDRYRYDVFASRIPMDRLNTEWWRLATKFQGICSPVNRTEADFDPASKFHVPADEPFMQYFVSLVLQFQFHKALCATAVYPDLLHLCDIDGSKEAGKLVAQMMELGSSLPWQDALKLLTGSTKLDAGPMLEYFQPLHKWLEDKNKYEYIGWTRQDPICAN